MLRKSFPVLAFSLILAACSTNEATGRRQFTGLMNTQSEIQLGAQEQSKVEQSYGLADAKLNSYVKGICNKITPHVERKDVSYHCTVLDSPVINAFALPGGYVNVNRGLLAFANSEAEVAAVLGHEMAHVTGRHISERYSHSTLTQLGAAALSIGLGSQEAAQAIGLGANLYLTSYSRSQETEADDLGIRYLSRAGYPPEAMAAFLSALTRSAQLEAAESGQQYQEMTSFLSTHPMTSDRVARAGQMAGQYPASNNLGIDRHLNAIDGMVYGDSAAQGFVKGAEFMHPELGFAFKIPSGFNVQNTPQSVVGQARSRSGAAFVFDGASKSASVDPASYIKNVWTQNKLPLEGMQNITVNGMRAATAQTQGAINNTPALMRLVAIEWSPTQVYRFQFAMPQSTPNSEVEALKAVTYSLRQLTQNERASAQPKRIKVVTASASDSVASLARRLPYDDGLNEMRVRALNGLSDGQNLVAGKRYKIIVQ